MSLVAIVGRPNVGKSTLFNRIIEARHAIVEAEPGVTRDRLYAKGEWAGVHFDLVDTGGIVPNSEELFDKAIREQAMLAIEEAHSIIFLVDGQEGVSPMDQEIASILRNAEKPVTLVVNKCDNAKLDLNAPEFYELGLGEPFAISAMSGRSTGDFLDAVVSPLKGEKPEEDSRLKIAIVGRPNVGKSSLANALIGKDRMVVTPIAGTTRDAIDTTVKFHGEEIVLIDTAGLRRRANISANIEMYATMRTARAIDRCDVALVLIDAEQGLEHQDKRIISQVVDARRGLIIVVNKWDLIEKDMHTAEKFTTKIREELRTVDYAPIVYISAVTKQRVTNVLEMSQKIQARRSTRIPTHELNKDLIKILEKTPPPSIRGRDLRINYVTQVSVSPPVFAFFLNHPNSLPSNYKRYIERQLRELHDFEGVSVSFIFRNKSTRE